jgi:hypothetical protein
MTSAMSSVFAPITRRLQSRSSIGLSLSSRAEAEDSKIWENLHLARLDLNAERAPALRHSLDKGLVHGR